MLDACEEYRLAVERGDADALMLMAHKQYWEDSGTPSGSDDYGYEGLRNVLLDPAPEGERHPLLDALRRRPPAVRASSSPAAAPRSTS